ncbi:UNVERIFIED_CONTAM: hypothetical protein IGO34_23065 [Salmonella enterica subsp. enterica serovar Weltevreden]
MTERHYTDGMRITTDRGDSMLPRRGDLIAMLNTPGLLTGEEWARMATFVRSKVGLGPLPEPGEEVYVDADTPLTHSDEVTSNGTW